MDMQNTSSNGAAHDPHTERRRRRLHCGNSAMEELMLTRILKWSAMPALIGGFFSGRIAGYSTAFAVRRLRGCRGGTSSSRPHETIPLDESVHSGCVRVQPRSADRLFYSDLSCSEYPLRCCFSSSLCNCCTPAPSYLSSPSQIGCREANHCECRLKNPSTELERPLVLRWADLRWHLSTYVGRATEQSVGNEV
jgi:hypothetical protein